MQSEHGLAADIAGWRGAAGRIPGNLKMAPGWGTMELFAGPGVVAQDCSSEDST
jgi:hypothetical protein